MRDIRPWSFGEALTMAFSSAVVGNDSSQLDMEQRRHRPRTIYLDQFNRIDAYRSSRRCSIEQVSRYASGSKYPIDSRPRQAVMRKRHVLEPIEPIQQPSRKDRAELCECLFSLMCLKMESPHTDDLDSVDHLVLKSESCGGHLKGKGVK